MDSIKYMRWLQAHAASFRVEIPKKISFIHVLTNAYWLLNPYANVDLICWLRYNSKAKVYEYCLQVFITLNWHKKYHTRQGHISKCANMISKHSWAPAEIFPEGGKITDTLKRRHVFGAPYKKSTFFGAPKAQTKILRFSRRFRLKYRVSI